MTTEPLQHARRSLTWHRDRPSQVYAEPRGLEDPDVVQLRAASMLVESGIFRSVTLVNLRSRAVVTEIKDLAASAGVAVEVLPGSDAGRVDASVRLAGRDRMGG